MNLFKNMSIRYKLIIGLVPFLAGALIYAGFQVQKNYTLSRDFDNINDGIELSVKISSLVHENQKERGRTSGYLASEGQEFKQELRDQRRLTTEKYQELKQYVDNTNFQRFSEPFQAQVTALSQQLEEFWSIRDNVDDFTIQVQDAIDQYSELNGSALDAIAALTDETKNNLLKQQVLSYASFLRSKEHCGIERALMAGVFATELNDTTFAREVELVKLQAEFMNLFQATARSENITFYSTTVTGRSVEEVDRMRALVTSRTLKAGEIQADYWFDQITAKVDLLKVVEDYISNDIQTGSRASVQQFWILLAVGVVFAFGSIALVLLSIRAILRNINKLGDYSNLVAAGNLEQTITLDTKDEIGHFATVFADMVGDIKKARFQIMKDKMEVDALHKQASVIFENVKQGIFLLSEDGTINDLYSNEMETIFGTEEVAGMDFVQFMRPLLVARDLHSVEMYIKQLFNKDVDESTLEQLNPLEHAKLFFPDKMGMMQTKFVTIEFRRIQDTEKIYNVMATAIDESANIKLQKEIAEGEQRSKDEMEQLLSILKIEPVTLSEYLDKTNATLEGISSRYEKGSKEDFTELLTYTYREIHNLKGNATLIDLQLMVKRLHEVEDFITDMRQRRDVTNDNFLEILFKINAINVVIKNMGDLMNKVQNISTQMDRSSTPVQANGNKFISALEKGAINLSNQIGKEIKLDLSVPEEEIPENLRIPFKDIIAQLIRNSLVHGIESPDERLAAGKSVAADINISINRQIDGQYKMNYRDDGRGLNIRKIVQKAKELNLIVNGEDGVLKSSEFAKILFSDGFSTAENIDDHAGRGQGMSVIKSIVKTYHGKLSISHQVGKFFAMDFVFPVEEEVKSIKVA
ncbi:MAG: hypothetical protein GY816_03045 [Cytophagales bacterium]|nr:hypothetical protein [Cytophagales bacterium]